MSIVLLPHRNILIFDLFYLLNIEKFYKLKHISKIISFIEKYYEEFNIFFEKSKNIKAINRII